MHRYTLLLSHDSAVAAVSRFRRRDISDFTYLLTYLLTLILWPLYRKFWTTHKDSRPILCSPNFVHIRFTFRNYSEFNFLLVWLENAYSYPEMGFGAFDTLNGTGVSTKFPKATFLHESSRRWIHQARKYVEGLTSR